MVHDGEASMKDFGDNFITLDEITKTFNLIRLIRKLQYKVYR